MTLPALRTRARRTRACGAFVLLSATCLLVVPTGAAAQIPHKFKNLKVLPKNISRRELIATMRGFTEGLGVRCSACHVRKEGRPRPTFDFASDKKAMKRDARVMLRMVRAINKSYLSKLPQRDTPNVTVTCSTCHRGVRRPEPIDQIVGEAIRHQGLDSAVAKYRALRKDYYGAASYDFTDLPLLRLADRLVRNGQADDALRLLRLAIEYNPRSARSYFTIGSIRQRQGDKRGAIDAYKKTLQLAPGFRPARQRLDSLGGG